MDILRPLDFSQARQGKAVKSVNRNIPFPDRGELREELLALLLFVQLLRPLNVWLYDPSGSLDEVKKCGSFN